MKPTPKSILREVNTSASKGKKNIIINERLNETHRIAQKSESSLHSGDRSNGSNIRDSDHKDYIREEHGYSGVLGYSNRSEDESASPSPQKNVGTSDDDDYESRLYPKYKSDANRSANSSFKNRLVVNSQSNANSEFQKAHIRKLQQEREQEISSKGMRDSADQLREKWLEEKAKRISGYTSGEKYYDTGADSSEYGSRKIDTFGARGADKFDRIEDKISVLERDLNSYSKDIVQNTLEHEEKNRSLNKVYEDFEDRMKDLKDEISQSVLGQKRAESTSKDNFYSRGFSAEGGHRSKNSSYVNEKKASSSKLKSGNVSHLGKSTKRKTLGTSVGKGKTASSLTFQKMQKEIERLRYIDFMGHINN